MTGREVLRDRYGNRIGEIEFNGSKRVLRDKYGDRLGEYDSHDTGPATDMEILLVKETCLRRC
jgi:hypothetical protein